MIAPAACPWRALVSPTLDDLLEYSGGPLKIWSSSYVGLAGQRLVSATCAGCGSDHAAWVPADHPLVGALERAQRIAGDNKSPCAVVAPWLRPIRPPYAVSGGETAPAFAPVGSAGTRNGHPDPRPAGDGPPSRETHPVRGVDRLSKAHCTHCPDPDCTCQRRGPQPTRGTVQLDGRLHVTLDCGCRAPWSEDLDPPTWIDDDGSEAGDPDLRKHSGVMTTGSPAAFSLLDLDNPGEAEREYVRSLCDWRIAFVPAHGEVNGEPVGDRLRGEASGEIGGEQ